MKFQIRSSGDKFNEMAIAVCNLYIKSDIICIIMSLKMESIMNNCSYTQSSEAVKLSTSKCKQAN